MMTFISLYPTPIFSSCPYSFPLSLRTKHSSFCPPLFIISNSFSPSEFSITKKCCSSKSNSPRTGANILVEALERQGVTVVFAYPGATSMNIHVALSRSSTIRTVIPRHEQGGIFAAEGYARSSGVAGVCMASSGPGATNLITGLADALLDSIPLIVITGQISSTTMGANAFQDIPVVQITRPLTKHNFLVFDVQDIPRIFNEAFFIATSGRPGPVLIDVPRDIQEQLVVPKWNHSIDLSLSFCSSLPKTPDETLLYKIVDLISEAKKPVLYIGGGCLNSSLELKRFVELTGIPVASTLTGLGSFPCSDDLSLQMFGKYGTACANYATDQCDLLLAFGVRFEPRFTRKIEDFATQAKIVHIDIDKAEIEKNKQQPYLSVWADLKSVLKDLNRIMESQRAKLKLDFSAWREELNEIKTKSPYSYQTDGDAIRPQYTIEVLDELTNGNAITTTGAGNHQVWAAQFYKYKRPRQLLTSGGMGSMGFGLPAAIGAALANPGTTVIDVDGDGSFTMNMQELATVRAESLPVKILLINDQHFGMLTEWAHKFCETEPHIYLGDPLEKHKIYPDVIKISEGFKIPAARITKNEEVRRAIQKMLETPGPYLLDVIISPP